MKKKKTKTLAVPLLFKNFEKIKVVWLYWFAAQHQKLDLFYTKFRADFKEFIPSV